VAVGEAVMVGVTVSVGRAVGVWVGVADGVAVRVGVAVAVPVRVKVGVAVAVWVVVAVGDRVGVLVARRATAVSSRVGEAMIVGVSGASMFTRQPASRRNIKIALRSSRTPRYFDRITLL
jgi:hypothetical protein